MKKDVTVSAMIIGDWLNRVILTAFVVVSA